MKGFYNFYQEKLSIFLMALVGAIAIVIFLAGLVLYQITHRPLPQFIAVAADGRKMNLTAHSEPNFLPDTLIRWATKAATTAYTFDFAHATQQLAVVRPFFTEAGWAGYQAAIQGVIGSVIQNQLIVNGVVIGTPVISNQGNFSGEEFAWRIQLPFLVTTQSADTTDQKTFTVILTLVKVPTDKNPAAIGIDQFVMVKGG